MTNQQEKMMQITRDAQTTSPPKSLEEFSPEKCYNPQKDQIDDRWKYRSRDMRCNTCMWFVLKEASTKRILSIGRCRRHAPTMNGYPVVTVEDWCGDHNLDENK